jgi:hypothetical protein
MVGFARPPQRQEMKGSRPPVQSCQSNQKRGDEKDRDTPPPGFHAARHFGAFLWESVASSSAAIVTHRDAERDTLPLAKAHRNYYANRHVSFRCGWSTF